jgi:hypothetical protein
MLLVFFRVTDTGYLRQAFLDYGIVVDISCALKRKG